MNPSRILAGLVFSLTLFFGSQASAQSCTTLVNSQFSWIQASSGNYVIVTGTSLRPHTGNLGALASYISGSLTAYAAPGWVYNPTTGVFTQTPARLTSPANSGRQTFSDRGYSSTYGSPQRWQNFSTWNVDNVQLELDSTGKFTLTLNTWNNTPVVLSNVTCTGNVLTGFNGTAVHSFTFEQFYLG